MYPSLDDAARLSWDTQHSHRRQHLLWDPNRAAVVATEDMA
jgi:hypothetical protein